MPQVTHCVECRYWESETSEDNAQGMAICLKRTCAMSGASMVVVRTRGDDSCDKFRSLTVDNLLQNRQSNRQ